MKLIEYLNNIVPFLNQPSYQQKVDKLYNNINVDEESLKEFKKLSEDFVTQLHNVHLTLGLISELKELYETAENTINKNTDPTDVLDEAGDVLWYAGQLCIINNLQFKAYPEDPVNDMFECTLNLSDIIKKNFAYDKDLNMDQVEKYMQVVVHDVEKLLKPFNYTLEEAFEYNVKKLSLRFKDNNGVFSQELAANKDANQEKEQLTNN